MSNKPASPIPIEMSQIPPESQIDNLKKELSMTRSIVTVLQRKLNQQMSVNIQLEAQLEDIRKTQQATKETE